jgi:hypothetical protein
MDSPRDTVRLRDPIGHTSWWDARGREQTALLYSGGVVLTAQGIPIPAAYLTPPKKKAK